MGELKLKPCPFCGGEALAFEYGGSCWVRCLNCRVMTEVFYNVFTDNLTNTTVQQDGMRKAIDAWNRRGERMTAEKAYAAVMAYCADKCDIDCLDCVDCIEMTVREALEKQIPRKIVRDERGRIRCPNNHNIPLEYKRSAMPYCPFCGQALDWESVNDGKAQT